MTVFGKTNWLARIALLPFMSSEDAAVQIQTFHVRVKCASFSLASSCSNAYIRAYVTDYEKIDHLQDFSKI